MEPFTSPCFAAICCHSGDAAPTADVVKVCAYAACFPVFATLTAICAALYVPARRTTPLIVSATFSQLDISVDVISIPLFIMPSFAAPI